MRLRIEQIGEDAPEEIIIRCRKISPEVEAIARQFGQMDKPKNLPAFFKGDDQYYLSLTEIMFFETDTERVFAHTSNDSFETRARLYELEEILPGNFIRVSRSAIINILHVMSIQRGLTRINLISFRNSHKAIYCSRMYSNDLIHKMEERVLYEKHKLIWGLLVIGIGILLLLNALGLGEEYDSVRIASSVVLLGIACISIVKFRFVLFFIPLAIIAYLWRDFLGIADMNIGLLLGAAALLGIGLSIVFRKHSHFHIEGKNHGDWGKTEEIVNDNENVVVDSSLGEHIKYIHANNLKKVQIKSSLSSTKVYFDQCQVSSEGLEINVNCSFTEVVLNVPKNWSIINKVTLFAGAVSNLASQAETADSKIKVLLTGNVNFAELKIIYV